MLYDLKLKSVNKLLIINYYFNNFVNIRKHLIHTLLCTFVMFVWMSTNKQIILKVTRVKFIDNDLSIHKHNGPYSCKRTGIFMAEWNLWNHYHWTNKIVPKSRFLTCLLPVLKAVSHPRMGFICFYYCFLNVLYAVPIFQNILRSSLCFCTACV